MVDWTKSMKQEFEYYEVDPVSWMDKQKLDDIKSSNIQYDLDTDTLGSATIEAINMLGETYVRIYLVTIQNGEKEKHPLGTFLVQTPSSDFDGKINNVSMNGYTSLMELKENGPQLGYTLLEDENIMENAYRITREQCRAPVVETKSDEKLTADFVANTSDSYITYVRDLIAQAKYEFGLDELGKILFNPVQKAEALQPKYTFDDGNSSILLPEVTIKHDIYGIPNVVEVIYSTNDKLYYSKVKNEDTNSPTSIPRRGREIIYRVTDPGLPGIPTQDQIDEYAERLLETLSEVEYQVSFNHGYYPVRIGDCVRLNYKAAGLNNIKAKITSQSITCKPGCQVKTTAVFTKKLWN